MRDRTTKPERRAVRASNPTMCRVIGTGATVRLARQRAMRPEAEQLDRFARAMGFETLMTESQDPGVNHWASAGQIAASTAAWFEEIAARAAGAVTGAMLHGQAPVGHGKSLARTMRGYRVEYVLIDDPMPGDPVPDADVYVDADGVPTVHYAKPTPLQSLGIDSAPGPGRPLDQSVYDLALWQRMFGDGQRSDDHGDGSYTERHDA